MPDREPRDGRELFGSDSSGVPRTWDSVRRYAMTVVLRRWPGVATESIEDCVNEAVLWGMTMWVKVPRSVSPNQDKTFRGARWAVSRKAGSLVYGHVREQKQRYRDRVGLPPVTDDTEQMRAAADVIRALQQDPREWESWARDLVEGVTERDAAEREGLNQSTINRRRRGGLERIRPLLRQHGLIGEH